jgi:hypothetical protein
MRRWARATIAAAGLVTERPSLWLPGGLAWVLTVGWIALLVGVARPPTLAELTFLGAGIFTSGAWPWNLVALAGGAVGVMAIAFGLVAVAEAALLLGARARFSDAGRIAALAVICAAPALLALVVLAFGAAAIGPAEFNSPQDGGGPLVRMAVRLAPIGAVTLVAIVAGAALHAAAARRAMDGRPILGALGDAPATLVRAGGAAALQALALLLARLVLLVLAAILLRVLWAPIDQRLALDGIDLAAGLLLVGFVAIWLCLVLAGGALHAWGSVSWTRVLEVTAPGAEPSRSGMETPTHP